MRNLKMKRSQSLNGEIQPKKKINLYSELSQVNDLKETENLYHSNLFRMQIEELLQEMQVSESKRDGLTEWCECVKSLISSFKASKEYDVADRVWMRNLNVCMPISEKYTENKGIWKFVPPTKMKFIGSFPLEVATGKSFQIDLCVEMPKACFKKSDYLNQRYHQKRALYLAYIAGHLKSSDIIESVCYSSNDGDSNSPVLIVKPSGKYAKRYCVRILLTPERSLFQLSRFIPDRNNLRKSWFTSKDNPDSENPATPLYNSSVLRDITCLSSHEFITTNLESNQKIKEAIILLKIWIHQRGLHKGKGSFNGFIITMFVLYLLKKHRISSMMSYYQVVRTTWLALAENEWDDFKITLDSENNGPGLESFSKHFQVLFVDPSGYLNLCAEMRKETLLRVKQESKLALKYLDDTSMNSFEYLFIKPVLYNQAFDAILSIHELDQLEKVLKADDIQDELLDRCGDFGSAALTKILEIMCKALGSRISLINLKPKEHKTWDIETSILSLDCKNEFLTFGLNFNPDRYFEILDKGPPGNSPEAVEFRSFWGSLAELRRFQDGSIHEAVVWPGNSISEKRNVVEHILKHCLSRHAFLAVETISYTSNQLDSAISFKQVSLPANIKAYGTGEEANMALLQSFDALCLSLRKLKDLPLLITSIQGIGAAFRFSQVFPPMPSRSFDEFSTKEPIDFVAFEKENYKVPRYVDALDVLVTLESSGKWPDHLEALLHVKAAFHLKFAKLLKEQCFLKTLACPDHVDVYKDGYVFRLIISCQKEIVLRKAMLNAEGMKVLRDNPKSLQLEHNLIALPKITSSIHALQIQFTSFSSAVRITKRWISCQMLSDFIPELAIELIMAHLFLQPAPYMVTNSPMIAFQRFLYFLSHHNWKSIPVIVNLNNDLNYEDYHEIQKNFDNCRSVLPNMFISTPLDKNSNLTKKMPSVQILQRLVFLAKESLNVFSDYFSSNNKADLMKIFRPSYKVYSALIQLKPKVVPKYFQHFESKTKVNFSFELENSDPIPITKFDPVQCYLKELRDCFSDIALFFYDDHGGDTIGVLFKPLPVGETEFKLSAVIRSKTEASIFEDFENLGKKLIHKIVKVEK